MTVTTLAGRLATSFGNPDAIERLLAPNARWSLPAALPFPHPMEGRDLIIGTMRKIWSEIYRPDVAVQILDEIGDDRVSSVRFDYRAFSLDKQGWYANNFTLFARGGPEGATEVFELFDTVRTLDFFRGEPTRWKGM
ncbi:hypothetical protein [Sphingobium tyrosinilyticum]|uniref:Nuclear transport factor 2 family protein n=1 Tax=Sphingobium tyrosinilyticum TaxID=2715436 RepID=A0ABV9F4S1_9SPHN